MVTAPTGAWVVSYWADKSSTTTGWTPTSSVTARSAACGADGGQICNVLADSAAVVPAGSYGGITATTGTASAMATMWSVVIAPSGCSPEPTSPRQRRSQLSCSSLVCSFDSSQSSDPDGASRRVLGLRRRGHRRPSPARRTASATQAPTPSLSPSPTTTAPSTRTTMVSVTSQPGRRARSRTSDRQRRRATPRHRRPPSRRRRRWATGSSPAEPQQPQPYRLRAHRRDRMDHGSTRSPRAAWAPPSGPRSPRPATRARR